jgi:hypothetical protein
MYTLMKSKPTTLEHGATGSPAHTQKEVAKYAVLDDAVAACEKCNREVSSRHYVVSESGKEYYAGVWLD